MIELSNIAGCDYLGARKRLRQENERLRAIIADKDEQLHRCAVLDTGRRNRITDLENKLAAVLERCEANNWMGTARVCGGPNGN